MKKAYTIDQQIARLKANGMAFDDEEKAKEILLDVGYYRLGFYSFPYEIKFPCLEHRDHKLKAGTTFKSVYDLYEFDTKLRRLLLNALDRIEVNIRTKLIYNISLRYIDDPCWFVNRKYVTSKFVNDFEEQVYAAMRKNPYPLVRRCTKDSGVTAFFTRSSAANIPVNMELCKKLGLNKDNYSVSIPLGATINMGGAAVTISLMAMMAAHTMGVEVGFGTAVILGALSAVSACGASGVAGGSLLLIPLACSLFGIGNDVAMQVVGIGFVIGVIQDSVETAINSSTDVLFAASAEYMQWRREGRDFKPGADA